MLLSVLNLFREKLPCSENFWRYKRNYELHIESQKSVPIDTSFSQMGSINSGPIQREERKTLASPRMSRVRALSPYMNREQHSTGPASGHNLLKYAIAKKDPSQLLASSKGGEGPKLQPPEEISQPLNSEGPQLEPVLSMKPDSVEELSICNMIPISNFKSNHLSRKRHVDVLMQDDFMSQMSPTAG